MTSRNNVFGSINIYGQSLSATPSIRIDPDISVPSIDFAPMGIDSNTMSIVSTMIDGVPTINICKGSTVLLSIQENNLYVLLQSISTPSSILIGDSTGNIGTVSKLPISMGGTGLSSLPMGSLLGSNGTSLTPVQIGTGMSINDGILSASMPVQPNMALQSTTPTPGQYSTLIPSTAIGIYTLSYISATTGNQIVGRIDMTAFSVVTIRITSVKKTAGSGGSAEQLYNIVKSDGIVKQFGNNASSGNDSSVSVTLNSGIISFSLYLFSGDTWRSLIQFISIV